MNFHKVLWIIVILAVGAVIVMGLFVKGQDLHIASLDDSVTQLSADVQSLVSKLHAVQVPRAVNQAIGLANPASVNCGQKGGKLQMEKKPDGGEYGVCFFEDNLQCEEWALYRGDCPVGGVKVTGYTNPANVYCAITGHESVESGVPGQVGTCKVGGVVCSATQYYETGECGAKK